MDKPLIEKVRDALDEACKADPQREIKLESVELGRVTGLVLSTLFIGMSPSDRQDLIWKSLDAGLTPHERARIIFIVADTPQEHAALQDMRHTG
jgi:hypothetical protein